MAKLFNKIPTKTFDDVQLEAGVLLKSFNPASPKAPEDADIICATTGGVQASCVPTYTDMGEDVDNCPNKMKELQILDGWECKLSFTALGVGADVIKMALGAADISGNKITPRADLEQSDFTNEIWWVGDKGGGGMVAICLKNVLSTGGFSLQTTKKGKGQLSVELTGHVSINAQDVVPMEFYTTDSVGE